MLPTIISQVLDGEATRSSILEPDTTSLKGLSGRWEMTVNIKDGGSADLWQVTLRIEGSLVSGDIFQPVQSGRGAPATIGCRDDWRFSFWGRVDQAITVNETGERWLVALCDATHRFLEPSAPQPRAIVSLRDEGGGRPAIRLSLLWSEDGSGNLEPDHERSGVVPPGATRATGMRKVLLTYVAVATEGTPQEQKARKEEIVRGLFEDTSHGEFTSKWTLEACMAEEGIDLIVEPDRKAGEPDRVTPNGIPPGAAADATLEDILVEVGRKNLDGRHADHDWRFVLILSGDDAPDPQGGRQILGRAYGLGGGQNRFWTRFGAIVHVARFEDDVEEFPRDKLEEIGNKVNEFRSAPPLSEQAAVELGKQEMRRRLICHYAMHELGHLLNLPHCWERDLGFRMLGRADPAACSYSNYPSSQPYGPAASAHFAPFEQDERKKRTKSQRLRYFEEVGLTADGRLKGFDKTERRFLHHAPFDQIAQGGRTFLDHVLPAPTIVKRTEISAARAGPQKNAIEGIEIVCHNAKDFQQVDEIRLWHWRSRDGSQFCYPPIPAIVRPIGVSSLPRDFRFEVGALQLVVKSEPAFSAESKTIALNPSRSKGLNAPGRFQNSVLLPWVTLSEATEFAEGIHEFSIQVVYYENIQTSFASNVVRVSYKDVETFKDTAGKFGELIARGDAAGLRPHTGATHPTAILGGNAFAIDDPFVP